MLSMFRSMVLSGLFVSVLGTSAIAQGVTYEPNLIAQGRSMGPGAGLGSGPQGDRWMQQLNLSSEQTQQMQAIRQKYQSQIQQRRDAVRQARTELRTLMSGNGSASEIRSKHAQIQQLQQELGNLQFESMLEMHGVLNAEQRRLLGEKMQQRQNLRQQGGQGRRQGRGMQGQ